MKRFIALLPPPFSDFILSVLSNDLFRGSALMFAGSMGGNIFAYLANVLWGRMLGPENYGVYTASLSVLYIISVPSGTVTTSFARFVSSFKGKDELHKVGHLIKKFTPSLVGVSLAVFVILALLSGRIAQFINVPSFWPVVVVMLYMSVSLVQTVFSGTLQGLQKFGVLSLTGIGTGLVRLLGGLGLVWLGFGYNGPLLGFVLASAMVLGVSVWVLRPLLRDGRPSLIAVDWGDLAKYAKPVFASSLGMMLLLTVDNILVKKFFDPEEAGLYGAMGVIARVILFISGSVVSVMFAQVAERHSTNGKYRHIFHLSLLLVGVLAFGTCLFYWLFPAFVVQLFYSTQYLAASSYLGLFGFFMVLYSIVNIFVNYFLSVNKTKITWLTLGAVGVQALLIWFRHGTEVQVLQGNIAATGILLLGFVSYYLWELRCSRLSRI